MLYLQSLQYFVLALLHISNKVPPQSLHPSHIFIKYEFIYKFKKKPFPS